MTTTEARPVGLAPSRRALRPEPSLLERAKRGDRSAIDAMFARFLPPNESIRDADYLGVVGMWGFGTHSFAAVTDRRVSTLRVGVLGAVTYQDGCLEHVNSGVVAQPSRLLLYVLAGTWLLGAGLVILGFAAALSGSQATSIISTALVLAGAVLLLPIVVALHYRLRKCGLVLVVREGVAVYAFSDRKLLVRANRLYRAAMVARENRVRAVGDPDSVPPMVPRQMSAPSEEQGRQGEVSGAHAGPGSHKGMAAVALGALLVVAGFALPLLTGLSDPGLGSGGDSSTSPENYGEDPRLDALWDACAAGDGSACYDLYLYSPVDSAYESFGETCGNRYPTGTDCRSSSLD